MLTLIFLHIMTLMKNIESDGVKRYAVTILSEGPLYLEFSDGICEGGGTKILKCW